VERNPEQLFGFELFNVDAIPLNLEKNLIGQHYPVFDTLPGAQKEAH